jgi:hypothetical protein
MPRFVDLSGDVVVKTTFGQKNSEGEKVPGTKQERDDYFEKVESKLLTLAGIKLEKGPHEIDIRFFSVMLALGEIHSAKSKLYGDYMETHGSEPELMALTQHFCDIKRKFVRAENYIRLRNEGDKIPLDDLLDTYADLAVYGIMGLELIFHILERDYSED